MTVAGAARYNGTMHVVILTALLPEARAVARAFHLQTRFANQYISGGGVTVALVGPCAKVMDRECLTAARGVIMCGLGGALRTDLAVGDVVIQGECGPISGLAHRFFRGKIATSEKHTATPAQKAALFEQSGALAVDMETQPVQALAHCLHIPFLAVRAISDTATGTLDPAFLKFVNAHGRPRVGRALAHLARHPTKLAGMLQIRRATNVALANLATTLVAIVSSGWPEMDQPGAP